MEYDQRVERIKFRVLATEGKDLHLSIDMKMIAHTLKSEDTGGRQ